MQGTCVGFGPIRLLSVARYLPQVPLLVHNSRLMARLCKPHFLQCVKCCYTGCENEAAQKRLEKEFHTSRECSRSTLKRVDGEQPDSSDLNQTLPNGSTSGSIQRIKVRSSPFGFGAVNAGH